MISYNFRPQICSIVKYFMCNRISQVKINNLLSSVYSPSAGVPQGSVFGPLIFNLYMSDIFQPTDHRLRQILYADNTLIYFTIWPSSIANNLLNNH